MSLAPTARRQLDAAVVGAGPAGSIAAIVLARAGFRVAIIDPASEPAESFKVGESLPPAARPLLEHLELISLVEKGPHLVSHGNCSAWGSSRLESLDFIFDPNGPGWHLDRVRFDADLRKAAELAGAESIQGRLDEFSRESDGWLLHLGAENATAPWLVDATGRSARVARRLGAERRKDDSLMAVFAWFATEERDRETRTVVESVEEGWWYTAKLPGHKRIAAFQGDPEEIGQLVSEEGWERLLADTIHVGPILRRAKRLTPLRCAEACGARLDRFHGDGWLATGDAALSFDPLSSQGLFNALYSGMKAGECLRRAMSGEGPGVLEEYSRRLESIRSAYFNRRNVFYASERRWPQKPFWLRRTS